MSPREACAVEVHRRGSRLNVDEWIAVIAVLALAAALVFGATHPQPQIASCYQPTEPRK